MKHEFFDRGPFFEVDEENSVGVIPRTFARDPRQVDSRVSLATELVDKILNLGFASRIDFLVWTDPRYPSDCGETAAALRQSLSQYDTDIPITCHEIANGDLFCGSLNYGLGVQDTSHCWIISPDASSYMTEENVSNMLTAAMLGCRSVGLAVNETHESVLEGRMNNTCCLWHRVSLLSVGAFDLRAAHAREGSATRQLKGYKYGGEVTFCPVHGVEEIVPLLRLVENYGKCLGTVLPQKDQRYVVPDPARDPEGYARHVAKLETKIPRQVALANSMEPTSYELSFLQSGIKVAALRKETLNQYKKN